MYDRFPCLWIVPKTLEERMRASEKNRKHLAHGIAAWQEKEIASLREYCHKRGKDFYVIGEPPSFGRILEEALDFLRCIAGGYSSAAFGYQTRAFGGSFYTGFQAWQKIAARLRLPCFAGKEMPAFS